MKTGEDFKRAVEEHGITYWPVRDCSLCGYELAYLFGHEDYEVIFDAGCDCVRIHKRHVRHWPDVANLYNMMIQDPEVKERVKQFWKFDND